MKLMFSVDGVMRYETKAATKELHTDLSKIWDMDYLTTYGTHVEIDCFFLSQANDWTGKR